MDYTTEVVTPPADEPATAQELSDHMGLNVVLAAVETQLDRFIASARSQFEQYTGRAIGLQTLRQHQPGWYCGTRCEYRRPPPVRLMRGPASGIVNLKYYDTDDTLQTVDPAKYSYDLTGTPGVLWFKDGVLPPPSCHRPRPVQVEYTAGWDAEYTPPDIVLAILIQAAHLYEYRESYSPDDLAPVPASWENFCSNWDTGMRGY